MWAQAFYTYSRAKLMFSVLDWRCQNASCAPAELTVGTIPPAAALPAPEPCQGSEKVCRPQPAAQVRLQGLADQQAIQEALRPVGARGCYDAWPRALQLITAQVPVLPQLQLRAQEPKMLPQVFPKAWTDAETFRADYLVRIS